MYEIRESRTFQRKIIRLQPKLQQRIRGKLRELAKNPYAANNNVKQLAGEEKLFRLRIGDWRIFYTLEDDALILLALDVEPRGSAYKH